MDTLGPLLILALIAIVFFGTGYLIARRWRKGPLLTAIYTFLLGLGLACLCLAVLFGACLCAVNNHL